MEKCSHPNVKYDWYQTETHVVINILVKQIKAENVRIDIVDSKLNCTATLADGTGFFLNLNLAHDVQPNQITWKVLSMKIEIKLKKVEALMWKTLEDDKKHESENATKLYPSSKPQKKDWDKIAFEIKKEEADEKLEGEAALSQLFQKIYADGSDETKKAMNKSFMESGGTVLSTSWNEVGAKTVDVKPPDGVEWKNWDS
ncbi:protein SGT1 homolog [Uloborus diversus]|uniref:protein SGT1 homolog n=1 Tax=Uloborus diversus TaxID=327109 RepID=UPI002409A17D|nr:protein SGT1 homolog [Uloborus diversus]